MIDGDTVDSVAEDTSTTRETEVRDDQPESIETSPESADGDADSEEPEETEDDGEESEEGDEQPQEGSDPELVTVEYDGEEYEVPKRLKDGLMATKDYTEKTQVLAEDRRNYEAERQDFSQYMEASKANSDQLANLAALDRQLQSYQAYDWNAAFDADITSATKLQHQFQQLQQQRESLVGQVQQSEQQRTQLQHENLVRTAQRTDAAMAKKIPNWGDARKSELGKFAVETLGFPAQMVSNAVTEAEIMALHYAEVGYKTMQQVANASKADKKPKVVVLPSKDIKPKRQAAPKTLSNVRDPEEYRKLRIAQRQRKKA